MPESLIVPPLQAPCWHRLAQGEIRHAWDNLALKLLLTRIAQDLAKDQTPARVERVAAELHVFFSRNSAALRSDLQYLTRQDQD